MKRIITLALFLLVSASIGLAQEREMVAHFFSDTPMRYTAGLDASSEFGLTATPGQVEAIAVLAGQTPGKFSFEYTAVSDKPYEYYCTIGFLHGEILPDLHKTLLYFGLSSFVVDGKKYPLNEMLTRLK